MAQWNGTAFAITAFVWQCIFLILYGVFVTYDFDSTHLDTQQEDMDRLYPMYQDVHVMIFIGFGFLMTFAAKYSFSAVGFNLLISAMVLQWSLLSTAFWEMVIHGHFEKIGLSVTKMIDADFNAGSMMISFGALLGKVTPQQMIWIALIGCTFNGLNFAIGAVDLQAVDMGGSIFVHTFGAYFGLGASLGLGLLNKNATPEGVAAAIEAKKANNLPNKNSDLFAMIGTIFLWMFWPSFNGALATGNQQHRVMINTVLALSGSCVTAYIFSIILRRKNGFNMVDIQNATLAGGVAVGSSADLLVEPWGAMLVGMVAGAFSVFGYVYITPLIEKLGIHDTCGVHNLHGMPGLMGAIGGAVSAAGASADEYGETIGLVYPAMGTTNATLAKEQGLSGPGEERTASKQAGIQIGAALITLLISFFGGIIAGLIAGSPLFEQEEDLFNDAKYWDLEEHEHFAHAEHEEHENKKNAAAAEPTAVITATEEPTKKEASAAPEQQEEENQQ